MTTYMSVWPKQNNHDFKLSIFSTDIEVVWNRIRQPRPGSHWEAVHSHWLVTYCTQDELSQYDGCWYHDFTCRFLKSRLAELSISTVAILTANPPPDVIRRVYPSPRPMSKQKVPETTPLLEIWSDQNRYKFFIQCHPKWVTIRSRRRSWTSELTSCYGTDWGIGF